MNSLEANPPTVVLDLTGVLENEEPEVIEMMAKTSVTALRNHAASAVRDHRLVSEPFDLPELPKLSKIDTAELNRSLERLGRMQYKFMAEQPGVIRHPDGVLEIPVLDGSTCCDDCFSTSRDVQRGHVWVAIPEGCKDEECDCHSGTN